MTMVKILVTGATGFLGKRLCARLKKIGHEVVGYGRNEKIGDELKELGVKFVKGNLEDEKKVNELCQGIDYVFHCGALSSPWGKYEDFYNANVVGTKNVIKGCFAHSVKRLIHTSSPSIYFKFDEKFDVKEDELIEDNFVNHYAKTKYLAEKEVDKAFKSGLEVVTIRPRAIFGPGDAAIFPRLIKVSQDKFVPIIGDEKIYLDLTYVENVVDALLLCMGSSEQTLGEKYNITNDETICLMDIMDYTLKKLNIVYKKKKISYNTLFNLAGFLEWFYIHFKKNKEPFLTRYTVSLLSKSQTLNIDKAKKELGYHPRVSVKEGIEEYAKWWKENGN